MSETLYRKYRPKNFGEVIGQKHIVQTLSNAVKNNRLGHAYLFTGPRGTGKTSIARILAKTANCADLNDAIPCEKCLSCQLINSARSLDIIEIDAASNTGVDNIRELRETVALPPTALKYKVYIIDEVHMLSTGAFNALLKTLEEPPAHVIFILATTEIHKVPSTIISRCQRFDFSRLPIQNIMEKLSLIAKEEKVNIDKSSLEMIALTAEGGMRDAESLLEQIIALEDKNITLKEVENILGTAERKFAHDVVEMIIANDSSGAISAINQLLNDGYDLKIFNKTLVNYLRQLMLLKINEDLKSYFAYELTPEQIEEMIVQARKTELAKIILSINLFLDAQNKISSFMLTQLPLEIAIIKATRTFPAQAASNIKYKVEIPPINSDLLVSSGITSEPHSSAELKSKETNNSSHPSASEAGRPEPTSVTADYKLQNKTSESTLNLDAVKKNWPKLLTEIRPFNHSLNALLSNCQPIKAEGQKITVATSYDFYRERLEEPANKLTLEEVFSKILGLKIYTQIITDKTINIKQLETNSQQPSSHDPLLNSALEIMGGKVVE